MLTLNWMVGYRCWWLRHASDSNDPKTRVHHCLVDPSAERQAAAKGIEGISPIPSEMRHQGNRALPGRHRRDMIRLSDWFLIVLVTLRFSNMTSCSNPSFVDDCPIKTSIYRLFHAFPIAMFDYGGYMHWFRISLGGFQGTLKSISNWRGIMPTSMAC